MSSTISRRGALLTAAGGLMAQAPPFRIVPSDIPNEGILFVDHQREGRSGHGGNTLTECANGDILSFYSNVSGEVIKGHGTAGWSEFRRSTDGGRTWGPATVLDFSRRVWDAGQVNSALVFSVITAPDGTLIAIAVRFKGGAWRKELPPVYFLSHDHGHTWSEPRDVDPSAGVEDIAMTFDASWVHNGEVFVVFFGGSGDGGGPYTLYVSSDNGRTFRKRSTLPFDKDNYYSTAAVLENGDFIVYSYVYPRKWRPAEEHDLPYVISSDRGYTWSEVRTTYFAKRIRNPQLSEKVGDYYFIHGRSGSYGDAPGNFVLYASRDAIHWDEGRYLHRKIYPGGDKYSGNAVIGKSDPKQRNRLLIQSSIVYDADTSRVNERHWWIEEIAGT